MSNGTSGTVSLLDVAARSVVGTVPTGRGSMGLVVTSDGRLAVETEPEDNRVSVLDVAQGSVSRAITFDGTLKEPHGVDLAGGQALVTTATTESLAFVDMGTFQHAGGVAVGGRPMIIAVSPDCTRAYLALRDTPAVAVVDVPGKRLVGTIDMGPGSVHGIGVLRDRE